MSLEDILYPFIELYYKSPVWLKNSMGFLYRFIPNRIKYGIFYKQYKKRIVEFQQLNASKIAKESEKLLIENVNQAISDIDFYNGYNKIKTVNDFKRLPIINKEIINGRRSAFLNKKNKSILLKANTGGSSGTPFLFFIHKGVTRSKEKAHFDWFWGKYGYSNNKRILMIRGRSLKDNSIFGYDSLDRKLIINCNLINESTIHLINNEIVKFKPDFIHAYPSSLLIFTKVYRNYIDKNNSKFHVNAVFLGSESLSEIDLKLFEEFYSSKIVHWYGHSECLIHAVRASKSGDFSFFPFYGYVELLDEDNNSIISYNKRGRIVATGFDNRAMPLIRYDTGDFAEFSENSDMQNPYAVILKNIEGRDKSIIYLKDGTEVSLTSLIFGEHHKEFELIKELQIVQNKIGEILVHIVPLNFTEVNEIMYFKKSLESRVALGNLDVTIEFVKKIKKTERGKNILLFQNVK